MAKFLDESGLRVLWEQIKKQHESHQADLVEILSNYATIDALNKAMEDVAEDLAGALNFVGVVDNLDEIENPKNGDIVLQGTAEYIYVEKTVEGEPDEEGNPGESTTTGEWVLIGDEGTYATKAQLEAVEKSIVDLTKNFESIGALTEEEIKAICV